jgi:hypothetical protein
MYTYTHTYTHTHTGKTLSATRQEATEAILALYKRLCACVSVDFKMPFASLEKKVKELMKELKEECEALSLAMWMEKVWVEGEKKGVCVCVSVFSKRGGLYLCVWSVGDRWIYQ